MIHVKRNEQIVETEVKDIKTGDVVQLYTGKTAVCTNDAICDDDEDVWYVICGHNMFHEFLIDSICA